MAASIHKGQMKINYIASFDGLRGIAVLLLMLVHGSYGFF
jgi:peptidoglycan/LPS O-acetylase OafA/YrhL